MEDIALMLKSALPLDDVDKLMIGPRDGIAVIWVDISDRPDLQLLADRSAQELGTQVMTAQQFMEKVVNFSGPGVFIELEPHLITELQARLGEWKQNR